MMLAISSGFDQELAGWFASHPGRWCGTAFELLAALQTSPGVRNDSWPQSLRALCSHIESHKQILRSLGVEAVVHQGYPRMISFRSCLGERESGESSSGTALVSSESDLPANLPAPACARESEPVELGQVSPTSDACTREMSPPSDATTDRLANGVDSAGDTAGGPVFKSTGEALVAIAEMRMQIREQGLDLEAAIDLVVRRTQQISRSCGILVGLRQQNSLVYPARTGVAATMGAEHFQANLFQFCLRTGRTMQLRDVQKHSQVGATCRQQGIGSLIIVPIFRNQEIAGAIEFLFKERRAFSISDVLDIELIAGVIGKSLNGSEKMESKQAEEREGQPSPRRSKTSRRKSGIRGTGKQV